MHDLAIYVVTWKRPAFLQRTLTSIVGQIAAEPEVKVTLNVVNNGTDADTRSVLAQFAPQLDSVLLLRENLGISQAYERILPREPPARCVMFSEDDMEYRLPFGRYVRMLNANDSIGAATGYTSPEHAPHDQLRFEDRIWPLKWMTAAANVILRTDILQSFRPFEIGHWANFDIHLFADAPNSLQKRGLPIAVLPGGAIHFGLGGSTWIEDSGRRPELTEEQLQEQIEASLISAVSKGS